MSLFCLLPAIWQFYEMFLEGPVYLHKRKLIRHGLPRHPHTTSAHYDLVYLRGGTNRVCTRSWIPIGDITVEMGGLVYLENSDAFGRQLEAGFAEKSKDLPPAERVSAYNKQAGVEPAGARPNRGGRKDQQPLAGRRLRERRYGHPQRLHGSCLHHERRPHNRIRLSTDIRYQRVSDEIDARWGKDWTLNDML